MVFLFSKICTRGFVLERKKTVPRSYNTQNYCLFFSYLIIIVRKFCPHWTILRYFWWCDEKRSYEVVIYVFFNWKMVIHCKEAPGLWKKIEPSWHGFENLTDIFVRENTSYYYFFTVRCVTSSNENNIWFERNDYHWPDGGWKFYAKRFSLICVIFAFCCFFHALMYSYRVIDLCVYFLCCRFPQA